MGPVCAESRSPAVGEGKRQEGVSLGGTGRVLNTALEGRSFAAVGRRFGVNESSVRCMKKIMGLHYVLLLHLVSVAVQRWHHLYVKRAQVEWKLPLKSRRKK